MVMCIYVCYVYIHACIFVCICIFMHVYLCNICARVCLHMCMRVHICMCICIYACIMYHVCICICICLYIHVCACMFVYVNAFMCVLYMHAYMCRCTCVCVCVCSRWLAWGLPIYRLHWLRYQPGIQGCHGLAISQASQSFLACSVLYLLLSSSWQLWVGTMSERLVRMAFAARVQCRKWETSTECQAQEQVLLRKSDLWAWKTVSGLSKLKA